MASIYKKTKTRGSCWWIAYTDENGKRKYAKGTTNRKDTREIADKLEGDARKRARGLLDPGTERISANAKVPIGDQIAAFAKHLAEKGTSADRVKRVESFVNAASSACEWETARDVEPEKVVAHLAALRDVEDVGPAALNRRLQALKQFSKWLALHDRITTDPLRLIKPQREESDRRRERRALTDGELAKLFDAGDASPVVTIEKRYRYKSKKQKRRVLRIGNRHLRIEHRGLLYRVAAGTGFRLNELRSLTPRSFDLNRTSPSVTVEAAYSKRRRRDVQPIRRDLADAVGPVLATLPPDQRIWGNLPDTMAPVIAQDLAAAKIDSIDDAGRVVDFHALRHTFITRLARAGITPNVAKELARHSTITLTLDRYSHIGLADERAALDSLPAVESQPTHQRQAG